MVHREKDPREEHGQCGERLGESLPAKFASDPSGEKHSARAPESGKEADGLKGIAEEQPLDSYDHGDKGRRVWRGTVAVVSAMTCGMASRAASPRSGVEPSWRGTGGQGAGSREGGIKRLLRFCPNHEQSGS